MRTAIKGRLGNKPELREVESAKGEKFLAISCTLYVADPTKKNDAGHMASVPFKITAYNERAKAISNMEPGDILTGIADLRVNAYKNKNGEDVVMPVWNISKIDESNKLAEQQTRLISAYTKGDIAALDIGLAGNAFVPTKMTDEDLPFEPSDDKELEG